MAKKKIAQPQTGACRKDVLAFLHERMQDDTEDSKTRLKAAELLGKWMEDAEQEERGMYVMVEYGNDFATTPKDQHRSTPQNNRPSTR